jgi:hypothetical protein
VKCGLWPGLSGQPLVRLLAERGLLLAEVPVEEFDGGVGVGLELEGAAEGFLAADAGRAGVGGGVEDFPGLVRGVEWEEEESGEKRGGDFHEERRAKLRRCCHTTEGE